ncbi:MAG: hypothetical protein ACM3VS_06220 [Candidatus Dadabacteria bacterium]
MKAKDWILASLITFVVALVANIIVSGCWNYFIKDNGFTFNWGSSIVIAIVLGITLPFTQRRRSHSSQ